MANIDPKDFRNTLGRFASGVTVITVQVDGQTFGMTASAFLSVSLEPPLVAVCVDHKASMHQHLQKVTKYGVSILNHEQAIYSNHFAGWHQEGVGQPFTEVNGMPLITDALAHLIVNISDPHEAGDHTLYIGEVSYLSFDEAKIPLLYYTGKYGDFQVKP